MTIMTSIAATMMREVNAPIMIIMTMVMIMTMVLVMMMMLMMMVMTWMSEAQTKHWYLAGGSSEHKKNMSIIRRMELSKNMMTCVCNCCNFGSGLIIRSSVLTH